MRKKTKPKPARLSPAAIRQVGPSQLITRYAQSFKAKTGLGLAKAIVNDIGSFERVEKPSAVLKRLWARRSATDIIKTRKIYIESETELRKERRLISIAGCSELTTAIVASLRATGFKANVVRQGNHTFAKLYYRNKVWKIDATHPKNIKMHEMGPFEIREENRYKKANAFAEGPSLASIGLKTHADFHKYEHAPKRRLQR